VRDESHPEAGTAGQATAPPDPYEDTAPYEDDQPPAPNGGRTAAAETTAAIDKPWKRAFVMGLSVWGAASLAYFLIETMTWMMRSEAGPQPSGFLEVWNQWDAGHYVTIALTGYNPETENPAFFPLYPLLIRYLEPVLPGGGTSAALIISHAACLAALTVLYRLVEDLHGGPLARRTVFYLMAFPFSFFLVAPYNESVFLLFTLASLYCMRKGYWWTAAMWGALASGTRQAGVLLALAFAYEYLRQRNWNPRLIRADVLAALFIPTGMVAFMIYSWQAFGDALKFVHVQVVWGREPTVPWQGMVRAVEEIQKASVDGYIFQPTVVQNVIDLSAALLGILMMGLATVGRWRLGAQSGYLVAFGWATLLLVLVSPIGLSVPLHGVPRYVIELIPAFIVLARMGANQHAERFYLMPAIAMQGVLVLGFYFDLWLA
jgi:hypothetical protein